MSNNYTTSRSIKVGTRVIVGTDFDPTNVGDGRLGETAGQVLVVTERHDRIGSIPVQLTVAVAATGAEVGTFGYRWFAPAPEETTDRSHEVILDATQQRDALLSSKFGKFAKSHKAVLVKASKGKAIDVRDVKAALFAAMRCATTANGQSMGRRADAELIERLWNSLPASDATTAPEVTQALTQAKAEVDAHKAATAALRDERDALRAETVRLYESRQQHGADRDRARYAAKVAEERAEVLAERLDYALSLLDSVGVAKVEGFAHAQQTIARVEI